MGRYTTQHAIASHGTPQLSTASKAMTQPCHCSLLGTPHHTPMAQQHSTPHHGKPRHTTARHAKATIFMPSHTDVTLQATITTLCHSVNSTTPHGMVKP